MPPPPSKSRYVIVTPARNETEHLEGTIRSVVQQTIRPVKWVIVDDGSDDNTGQIVERYASEFPWIALVRRLDRGFREPGAGVIEAFQDGYRLVQSFDWDFIVKLDGDLSFEPDYFERCFEEFARVPRLGIVGGTIHHAQDGSLRAEHCPAFHVRGATKIYRRECWQAIGGLLPILGWDTVDEVKANMLGWRSYSVPHLKVFHHRYTGSADGAWRNAVKNGQANYVSGYHPLFMLAKCLKRLLHRPFLVDAVGLFYGFVTGYLGGIPQLDDAALIRYVRQQQVRRLLLQESIWK